jgi:hypothetical protein
MLVAETASALRGLRLDPGGLVIACRRIVERHPTTGPLWWLCAHVLTAPEPFAAAQRLADECDRDRTPAHLAADLADDATVVAVGWPDLAGEALVRRGDLRVLVDDAAGQGSGFARRLERAEVEVELVSPEGAASAAACADVVLLEAIAVGPDAALCPLGSLAVAAAAYCAEVPVWLTVGVGRRLPAPLWRGMLERMADAGEPWEAELEVVSLALVGTVVGPAGTAPIATADLAPECPAALELLRSSAM